MAPFAPNPFYHQGPILDCEHFFGREADVRKVLSRLRRGQSVSVLGKERIGKTSFLYHVSSPRVVARHRLPPEKHLFIYVDCRRLVGLSEDDCFDQIRAIVEKRIANLKTCLVLVPEDAGSLDTYDWLGQVILHCERKSLQTIVQLDDCDWLAANPESRSFLDKLRALVRPHSTMAYLTTSRVPLVELGAKVPHIAGSPFFNIFWTHELQPFDPNQSHRLLVTRLESVGVVFPEVMLACISDLGQGEPYRLQLVGACAYDVWCKNGGGLCEDDHGRIEKQFNNALRSASYP